METIIRIKNLTKIYNEKTNPVTALKDINIDIRKGDIYGIIGMSGAGKSTLVRCLNFLEKPTSGTVIVQGNDLSTLSARELRKARTGISMIFQHFNLLMQKNVINNICFPLRLSKMKSQEAYKRCEELLEIVALSDKAKAYPSQLSGGQKQRVAIARALATNPEILLCDEATSALDPQTTTAILSLLKDINKKYGITIVIITHEMAVVQEICTHVAIVDNGRIVESGSVEEIFNSPKTPEARKLLQGDGEVSFNEKNHRIRVLFHDQSSFEPFISDMILRFKIPVNIIASNTKDVNGIASGDIVLQLPDNENVAHKMIVYLESKGLKIHEEDGNNV